MNVKISDDFYKHYFLEVNKFSRKFTNEEIDLFLNNFFFEKKISVPKKEISNETVKDFIQLNIKLKEEKNMDLNKYIKTYFERQLNNFKNDNFHFNEKDILKSLDKKCKCLVEKINKVNKIKLNDNI